MAYSVTHLETASRVPIALDARILYSSGRFEVIHLTLQPGEGMELHMMPFEVIFFVREGAGTLMFEEGQVAGTSGDCIRVEPGVKRGWKNTSLQELKIVVMKLMKD